MNIEASNQREQYFAEYFNLRKKKKELRDKKTIILPQKKQYFKRTREYLKGEHADIEAIASGLSYGSQSSVKNNFGHRIKYCQTVSDGAENGASQENQEDSDMEAAQEGGQAENFESAKKQQAQAVAAKRIIARAATQTTLRYAGFLASSIFTIFAAIILFVLLILTMMMWLFGAM